MSSAQDALPGSKARAAALQVLSSVLRQRRPLDVSLDNALSGKGLDSRDAGFARAIATETLRRFGQLNALVHAFVPKAPQPHKAGPALEILLAGACELLFLNVAAHAAVDGANRLAQADAKAVHFKGLINAVLRRIAREGAGVLAAQDAEMLNTPDWLWARWCDAYGADTARLLAKAHALPPALDLALKNPNDPYTEFTDGKRLMPHVLRLEKSGRVDELPGYADGTWWVQDAAASLPALLLGDVTGQHVIDLCAAPGGKTAQLALAGAQVTAVDRSAARLARLAANLARLGLRADIVAADATQWEAESFDAVLLDAPCLSTGTIRRHPDIAWIKREDDLAPLADLQRRLLDRAVALTKPGGLIVYCTCSLEPEEGERQIAALLARDGRVRRRPIAPDEVGGLRELVSPAGDLRTLPCHLPADDPRLAGLDGFYAARLERV